MITQIYNILYFYVCNNKGCSLEKNWLWKQVLMRLQPKDFLIWWNRRLFEYLKLRYVSYYTVYNTFRYISDTIEYIQIKEKRNHILNRSCR